MYTAGPEGVYKNQAAAQAARQEAKPEPDRAEQEASFRARVGELPAEPRAAWPKDRGSALLQELQQEANHNPEVAALLPNLNGEIKIMKPGHDLYRSLVARRGLYLREKRGELADKINSLLIILDDEDGSRELQQPEIQSPQAEQEQRARDQVKIDQFRESLVPPEEKERREIIKLVLDKGSAWWNTDVQKELSPRGWGGFQSVGTPGRVDIEQEYTGLKKPVAAYKDITIHRLAKDNSKQEVHSLTEVGCSEIVDASEITKYKRITTVTQERSGIFGLKKRDVPRYEQRAAGQLTMQEALSPDAALRARLTNEELAEPATRLHYVAHEPRLPKSMSLEDSTSVKYNAPGEHRGGNHISVDILLPRSVAQKVMQHLKRRPGDIRQIVESIAKEELHFGTEQWEQQQPPYSNWDKFHKKHDRQPGIYIADKTGEEFDARHVHAFS